MDSSPRAAEAREMTRPTQPWPFMINSKALLQGRRELVIQHGDDFYRLRLTASNKLILTK